MPAESFSLRTTAIELEHDVVVQFRGEAAKRETTVPHLIHDLLAVIATDRLTSAILDDGTETEPR